MDVLDLGWTRHEIQRANAGEDRKVPGMSEPGSALQISRITVVLEYFVICLIVFCISLTNSLIYRPLAPNPTNISVSIIFQETL